MRRLSDDTFVLKRPRNYTYYKEFPFLLERKRNDKEYFHCSQRDSFKCKARLVINRFKHGDDQITQLKEHNHELILKRGIFKSIFEPLNFNIFFPFRLHFFFFANNWTKICCHFQI